MKKFEMNEIATKVIKETKLPDIIDYCIPDNYISAEIHSTNVNVLGYLNVKVIGK